jgi:hypothetical protein
MGIDLTELVWLIGVIAMAVWATGNTPDKEPIRVKVCLVESGPDKQDVTTSVWSDKIDRSFQAYPGSHCGACGSKKLKCPEQ